MDSFTILDGGVAIVILLSAILAYARGLTRELMAIVGWVGAAVVAFLFAPRAMPLVKEIPYVGDFLRDSCELSVIAAFAAVFAVALVIVSLFTPLFSSLIQRSALGGVDQGLGFLFGVVRGLVLVAVALVLYDRIVLDDSYPVVDNSRTAQIFAGAQDDINQAVPTDAPGWIVQRYEELVNAGECEI
ncbi:CvpA family protein [Anianabacter salinae]|uniref:CvpA family protein n=1 Tax=Anianabacter salinae TaxID=2851023 RepID=UPI00225E45B0|nr:CvpA family protein [Anianabacter salinae]MBV0911474.1 CvpA family protein [Anianabacter salinae]